MILEQIYISLRTGHPPKQVSLLFTSLDLHLCHIRQYFKEVIAWAVLIRQ